MIAAVESGYFRRRIADSAFRYQSEVDTGRKLVVGVNAFVESESTPIPTLQLDPQIESRQKANLSRVRQERDSDDVTSSLDDVRSAAASGRNIMPALLEAARRRATLGEMVAALADVLGRYQG
jgi:methylmalonyl-CoA mutase N-terminal domain/subunit